MIKGTRVRLSPLALARGISPRHPDRQGVVATRSTNSEFVVVRWDGLKSSYSYAAAFIQKVVKPNKAPSIKPAQPETESLSPDVAKRFAHIEQDDLIDEIMKADALASRCFRSAQDVVGSDPDKMKRLTDLGFQITRRGSALRAQFNREQNVKD